MQCAQDKRFPKLRHFNPAMKIETKQKSNDSIIGNMLTANRKTTIELSVKIRLEFMHKLFEDEIYGHFNSNTTYQN